jgi:hypothetical protein
MIMEFVFLAIWHFAGLVAALAGAYLCAGLGGTLLVFGVWAMAATMFDLWVDIWRRADVIGAQRNALRKNF